ncbi:MAG: DUF4279 domain-containing protein [Deltaproteobacteria bacterium]|nr:DUF4279 domain-containing protein [Deltaproteobacteria bacterium]
MRSFYSLRIQAYRIFDIDKINNILDIVPTKSDENYWELEKILDEESEYYDYINYFLDILEGKYQELEQIGIEKSNISIWLIYEYDQQCNMEFSPSQMKRLGENDITFCISCLQK